MKNSDLKENGSQNEELNFFQRFIGIIISPVQTMDYLAQKPKILFGILASFLAAITYYLLRYQMFREYMLATETAKSGGTISLTDPGFNKMVMGKLISSPIVSVVWLLIITFLILGLVKLFKGAGTFKQFLSVTGYANVIVIVNLLAYLIVSFFTGKLLFNDSLTSITNLFAAGLKGTYLYGLLRGIGVFGIWYFTILAIGISSVSKLNKIKVTSIILFVFIICIVLGAFTLQYS